MTPTLQALARAYMALPGAPGDNDDDGWTLSSGVFRSAKSGILWLHVDRKWIPDLTDPATGGVMLGLLGAGWAVYQREHDGFWEMHRPDGEHHQEGATLAEAVARVAVAVGRAG